MDRWIDITTDKVVKKEVQERVYLFIKEGYRRLKRKDISLENYICDSIFIIYSMMMDYFYETNSCGAALEGLRAAIRQLQGEEDD